MSRIDKNALNGRAWSPAAWLQFAMVVALILVLAGCGSGGTAGSSSATGQKKTESQGTSEGASKTGKTGKTEQASGGEAGRGTPLGTPALGDAGAPVVMVEYADYQ